MTMNVTFNPMQKKRQMLNKIIHFFGIWYRHCNGTNEYPSSGIYYLNLVTYVYTSLVYT